MKLGFKLFSMMIAVLVYSVSLSAQDEATPASIYNDGVAALKAKEYDKALELMTQALEKADPEEDANIVSLASRNGAVAAYYAGNAARREDKIDEAIEIYQKGIDMSPEFYVNYGGMALALNNKGMAKEAMNAYITGGQMAAKGEKEDKAKEYMDKATFFVSQAYSNSEWDKAIELGEEYLEHGESPDVHYYLARAMNQKGQLNEALEHANKAIEMEGGGEEGRNYFAQGEIYESMGNTSAATAAYKKVTSGKYSEMAQYKIDQMANN